MDPLTIAAASGMRSRMESLEMLANNLANAETSGYKADREFYNLFVSPEAAAGNPDPATLPNIESNWTDYSQGSFHVTSNQLDFALEGKGFFAVNSPTGALYTRNGSFRLSTDGTLSTAEGYAVRGADGKPIKLDPARAVEAGQDGVIRQGGEEAGRLQVVEFSGQRALAKRGATYFEAADPAAAQPAPSKAAVHQGKLEGSNVGSAESAIRLVSVMRSFEMLQRAVGIGADMNKKAVEEVARVG